MTESGDYPVPGRFPPRPKAFWGDLSQGRTAGAEILDHADGRGRGRWVHPIAVGHECGVTQPPRKPAANANHAMTVPMQRS